MHVKYLSFKGKGVLWAYSSLIKNVGKIRHDDGLNLGCLFHYMYHFELCLEFINASVIKLECFLFLVQWLFLVLLLDEMMEAEKKRSKGGFLQLFDWNGKSRKKLFSNNSELDGTSLFPTDYENAFVNQFSNEFVYLLIHGFFHHRWAKERQRKCWDNG